MPSIPMPSIPMPSIPMPWNPTRFHYSLVVGGKSILPAFSCIIVSIDHFTPTHAGPHHINYFYAVSDATASGSAPGTTT
jgi:hypothetical protein